MKKEPVTLSIFFPTFNEEANIATSVTTAVQAAEESPFVSDFEVIVVNDGSSDNTAAIVEDLARQDSRVRLVNHEVNRGAGAALKTGFASAKMDYVFYTDADLQFDIKEINNLLIHLDTSPIVIGYRAPRRDPFMRLVNAKGWNVLIRLFFGLKVRDVDCAFKVFETKLVQSVTLRAEGAMTLAETLIRLDRKGITFKQVPVTHWPRVAGSPTGAKLSVIIRAFREMLELYFGELGSFTQKQALKYMSVGVINTAVDLVAYILLTRETTVFQHELIVAKLFSFLAGTVSSFVLNRYWTFNLRGRFKFTELVRFYSVISLSLVVNVVVMAFFTNVLGIYDLIALLLTTVFTFAVSYTLSKAWVFIQHTSTTSRPQTMQPKINQP